MVRPGLVRPGPCAGVTGATLRDGFFAVLMDVREPVTLTFRITRPSDAPGSLGTLLGVAEIQTAPLPGDTAQAWIATQLSLAEEGRYEIQLFGNEAYMAHKPFIVSTTNAAAPKED